MSSWLDPAPRWLVVIGWSVLVALWHTSVVALAFATWRLWRHAASAPTHYRVASAALALATALTVATPAMLFFASARAAQPVPGVRPPVTAAQPTTAARGSRPAGTAWPVKVRAIASATVPWLGAAWCLGVGFGLIRFGGGLGMAHWIRRRATAVRSAHVVETAADVSRSLGLPPVTVLASAHVEAPVVIGARVPAVLLPVDLEQRLEAAALSPLLAHELAHVDRRDYAANLLQSLADVVLFFSPGARWLSRSVREAREFCCDDIVAAHCGAGSYVSALTTLARLGVGARVRPVVSAAGPRLIVRIRRLLQEDQMTPFARYRLGGAMAAAALVAAAGIDVVPVSALAVARAGTRPTAPAAPRREAAFPMGFLTLQPGSAVRLRSMQSTDAGLCGTAEIENLANVAVTGVRFVSFAHAPSPLPNTSLSTACVGTSDLLAIDLAPGQQATVDVGLLTEAQAREMLGTPYAQLMCGIAEVRYANGARWEMAPATILGPERADIPRALIGQAGAAGADICRDDAGGEYSDGAVVAVRFEPMTFARCAAGRWRDHQLSAVSAGKPFVRMDLVLAGGQRPQIGVEPGHMARLEIAGGNWGITPTVDTADERRVRLEIVNLTADPATAVADFWTTVGAAPVNVAPASFTVQVRSTRND